MRECDFKDSRAIKATFLEQLKPGGKFRPYIEFVKKHKELCLCFRGSGKENALDAINIYYNNHTVFKIYENGRVEISFNHARYCEDWENKRKTLVEDYGFGQKKLKPKDNSVGIGCISRSPRKETMNILEMESIYMCVVKPMMEEYFRVCDPSSGEKVESPTDYFRKKENVQTPSIKSQIEKRRQQELFTALKNHQNGYYIYDLEFHDKYKNQQVKDEAVKKEKTNFPDMLALRFEGGKPCALVLVELKCTKSAMFGSSSIEKHIKAMKEYISNSERIQIRINEACELLNQYREIELFDGDIYDPSDIAKNPEIVLAFTDEAKDIWIGKKELTNERHKTKIMKCRKMSKPVSGFEDFRIGDDQIETLLYSVQ